MGEDRVLSQFSALASVVFSMAFTIVFDGMIRRRRQRDRRISYCLKQYCRLAA